MSKNTFEPGDFVKVAPASPGCSLERERVYQVVFFVPPLLSRPDEHGVAFVAGACAARSLGHTIDQGMSAARRLYSSQEGWSDHKAIAIEVPSHLIEEVYTQEVANVSP